MRVAARIFIKSAWPFYSMAVMCAAFSGAWLLPTVVWSQVVVAKKSPARQTVYLGSVYSEQFPSRQNNCAPTEFCKNAPGPVSEALNSSFADKLRAQGVIVVRDKPSGGTFDELSVVINIRKLHSSPPIIPKRFVCDVEPGISRRIEGKLEQNTELKKLHSKPVAPVSESADNLVRACLNHAASLVREGIKAIDQPQKKR